MRVFLILEADIGPVLTGQLVDEARPGWKALEEFEILELEILM
jgi:hypothetical protein